ncbi:MAG: protein kinase [Myxococcota bacterium]|nr:protein kinase [Myxococcota bacterium]
MTDDPRIQQVLKATYRIDARLDAGGMGTVYLGTQLNLDRRVAIKVLHERLFSEPSMRTRFHREATALAALDHRNVVRIIDAGECPNKVPFLVMEYLEGLPLPAWLDLHGPLPASTVLRVMTEVCEGIGAAHAQGLLHRDLKPDNIWMSSTAPPIAKILDFGLVRDLDVEATNTTEPGMLLGTPGYVAPEQLWSQTDLDHRVDQYALGGILYFLVAGQAPYDGPTPQAIITKQLSEPPAEIDIETCRCPAAIAEVITRAMTPERDDRYASITEFLEAIEAALGTADDHKQTPTPEEPSAKMNGPAKARLADPSATNSRLSAGRRLAFVVTFFVFLVSLVTYAIVQSQAGLDQKTPPIAPSSLTTAGLTCPPGTHLHSTSMTKACIRPDGTPNGPKLTFYAGGQTKLRQHYEGGILDGPWRSWYESGKPQASGEWSNGLKEGRWQRWSVKGQLRAESHYIGDKLDGRKTAWFENGRVKEEATYIQGQLDGRFVQWFENGRPQLEGQYRLGKKDGRWLSYTPDGHRLGQVTYSAGPPETPANTAAP